MHSQYIDLGLDEKKILKIDLRKIWLVCMDWIHVAEDEDWS